MSKIPKNSVPSYEISNSFAIFMSLANVPFLKIFLCSNLQVQAVTETNENCHRNYKLI